MATPVDPEIEAFKREQFHDEYTNGFVDDDGREEYEPNPYDGTYSED